MESTYVPKQIVVKEREKEREKYNSAYKKKEISWELVVAYYYNSSYLGN
jgi:hypothetical protein